MVDILALGILAIATLTVTGPLPGDIALVRAIQGIDFIGVEAVMRLVTWAGGTIPIVILTVALAVVVAFKGERTDTVFILLTVPVRLLNEVAKVIIGRPRPSFDQIDILLAANGFSFPSGHASSAVILFGFLAWLAALRIRAPALRIAAVLACLLTILVIGLSRVYLGAHWPSDVIGGYAFGVLIILPLIAIHTQFIGTNRTPNGRSRFPKGNDADAPPSKRVDGKPSFSEHARLRMSERRISEQEVRAVLTAADRVWRDRKGKPIYLGHPGGRRIKVVIAPNASPPHIVTVAD